MSQRLLPSAYASLNRSRWPQTLCLSGNKNTKCYASTTASNKSSENTSSTVTATTSPNKSSSSSASTSPSASTSNNPTTNNSNNKIFINKKILTQQYVKYSMLTEAAHQHQQQKKKQQNDSYNSHHFPTPVLSTPELLVNKKKHQHNVVSESRERLTHIKHFYADPEIDKACDKPLIRLNPIAMMYMGVSNDNSHLLKSANYLRNELPIRLAHIIKEMRNLPFIIACNPSMLEIHDRCIKAFREFDNFDKEIKDLDAERRFNQIVYNMLEMNKDLLALLCDGFKDTRRYINNESFIKTNLNRILSARLGIRLLSEHHIALNKQSNLNKIFVSEDLNDDYADEIKNRNVDYVQSNSPSDSPITHSNNRDENWLGIIHRKFSPKKLIENSSRLVSRLCTDKYGVTPKVKIDGHTNAQFPYLPLPLEYILPELLKNAFRATYEQHRESPSLPDVNVTIAVNDKDFVIRIRDRGGGIPHPAMSRIFDYHFTTAYEEKKEETSGDGAADAASASGEHSNDAFNIYLDNSAMGMICEASSSRGLAVMHGYGFGLPTSKAYAEYLGGSLTCQSMQGIGSDFYLRLSLLDIEPEVVRI